MGLRSFGGVLGACTLGDLEARRELQSRPTCLRSVCRSSGSNPETDTESRYERVIAVIIMIVVLIIHSICIVTIH